jgi:hypothetical protein
MTGKENWAPMAPKMRPVCDDVGKQCGENATAPRRAAERGRQPATTVSIAAVSSSRLIGLAR